MIINLRGTNGSGKSTVARHFIEVSTAITRHRTPVDLVHYESGGKQRMVEGYACETSFGPLVIVGPYKTDCGGCDAIKTQDLVCTAVRNAAKLRPLGHTERAPHVLFEGVIVSTIFKRYLDLSRELGEMVWAYLDTPLDVCLARIQARNGGEPIKEKLVADKIKSIETTRYKAKAVDEKTVLIPHRDAIRAVTDLYTVGAAR